MQEFAGVPGVPNRPMGETVKDPDIDAAREEGAPQ